MSGAAHPGGAGRTRRGTLDRRRMLALALGTASAPALARRVRAASFQPSRAVRLVVPFAAGGANDIIARVLAERLAAMWGQPVVVENRPGGGANIGTAEVARAEGDGHTLLITSSAVVVNRFLYETLPFDPAALAPVSLAAVIPNLMVVRSDAQARSVADFIAEARARPGQLNFGSAGIGSSLHLIGELFKRQAGIDMRHVPYRGAAPAMNDLIGGHIQVMFDTATVSMPQIRGGRIRALGISTRERLPSLSDVPPIADTVPGFDVGSWFALYCPARTARDVVAKTSEDVRAALAEPAARSRLEDLGARVAGSTPEALAELMESEVARWGPLIREAGIRAEGG